MTKYRHSVLDWQVVAAIRAGANDLAAIRNENTLDAGIAGLPLPARRTSIRRRFPERSLGQRSPVAEWRWLASSAITLRDWEGGGQGRGGGHQVPAREIGVRCHVRLLGPREPSVQQ